MRASSLTRIVLPSARRAAYAASSGDKPASCCSSASKSKWSCNSRSRSASRTRRRYHGSHRSTHPTVYSSSETSVSHFIQLATDTFRPMSMIDGKRGSWRPADDVYHLGQLCALLLYGGAKLKLPARDVKMLNCSARPLPALLRSVGMGLRPTKRDENWFFDRAPASPAVILIRRAVNFD